MELLLQFWESTSFTELFECNTKIFGIPVPGELIMICIACLFLYLAIKKDYEPYILLPIAFGMLMVNLPGVDLMDHAQTYMKGDIAALIQQFFTNPPSVDLTEMVRTVNGGFLYYLYQGTSLGIYPPLVFLCIGAGTDFGPIIANPRSLLLGAAAQLGIFITFIGAILLGFSGLSAAAIGIIGGASGPTALYLTNKLAPHLLGPIAIAAYSYMALVPIIQPPIMRALTTKEERAIKMEQLRPVSKTEKILFPIVVTIFTVLLFPSAAALICMLMLGNLLRESGRVPKLVDCLQNNLMFILSILLGLTVGAKANAEAFLTVETISIIVLGLIAFAGGTAGGVLLGKLMCKLSKGKFNPLIGAAGVSAVPMSARVVQKEGQKYNPSNFMLMHAMGPNVAGAIGSAVAAGVLMMFFG